MSVKAAFRVGGGVNDEGTMDEGFPRAQKEMLGKAVGGLGGLGDGDVSAFIDLQRVKGSNLAPLLGA